MTSENSQEATVETWTQDQGEDESLDRRSGWLGETLSADPSSDIGKGLALTECLAVSLHFNPYDD